MAGKHERWLRRSIEDPEGFWGEAASALHWNHPWDRVLDASRAPFYRWFSGGRLNVCYNCLDRHVAEGRGDQLALIHDSPVTGRKQQFTYARLTDQVARFAGVLRARGVDPGDRVIIYMPMVPEAVIAMLACARLGAVHSVVFGGFASSELAKRIDDARPRVVVSASCGIEPGRIVAYKPLLDAAIAASSHPPECSIVLQRPEQTASLESGRDRDWADVMATAVPVDCVPMEATDPLYILYTSGTTGKPKGVVRDAGGYAVALKWSMKHVYDVDPGDCYWAASDVGWVVGHSYIVYGPLLHGCTTVLYEGKPVGTPDAGAFWRVCEENRVRCLFTAPTAIRAIRRDDPSGATLERHDLSALRSFFLAGERCDTATLEWVGAQLGVPVIDHWWQTESGWPMACNCLGLEPLPIKPGSPARPVPGYDIRALNDRGENCDTGEIGSLCVKLPLPPGGLTTLWRNDAGFRAAYLECYPGYYLSGDAGYVDADGYVWVMSRIDDVINVAGHRLSTGAMEEVLAAHQDVAECAVFGRADALKGEVPLGLVVLKSDCQRDTATIRAELVAAVREQIGPVAAFRQVVVVRRLPKTRSGKILRATMKKIADGQEFTPPATIDDPAILDEIAASLEEGASGIS